MGLTENYNRIAMIFVTLALLFCLVVLVHPVGGYNYEIYYNFGHDANAGVDIFDPSYKHGIASFDYLDVTPASLLIYQVVAWIQDHLIPRFWYVYQVALSFATILITAKLIDSPDFPADRRIAVLVVLCLSPAYILLSASTGEDKAIYSFGLVLLIYLVALGATRWGFIVSCIFAAVSGFGLFMIPLLLIARYHQRDERPFDRWDVASLVLGSALFLALVSLYYPQSQIMLSHRLARESLPPFHYSIWRLVPQLFHPLAARSLVVASCLLAYAMYFLKRTSFAASLAFITFSFFFFANYTVYSRFWTVLFLPLLAIGDRRLFWLYALAVFAQLNFVLAYHALLGPFPLTDDTSQVFWHIVWANSCLMLYMVIFALEALASTERQRANEDRLRFAGG